MTTIYRASDFCDARIGYSFAADRETAEAYRDNPGFGGDTLFVADVELTGVLDLTESTDPWADLAEAAGMDLDQSRYAHHFARVLPTDDSVCEALAAAGYHWVRFRDDYPVGAETLIPVSEEAADEADGEMDET